ncbi:hypothetical protein BKA59DRAFT_456103 [Fusarium tricinctum]|uniref:BTB domain-containing protein n=1 Tax=Fusarium tricinctum TaxID=61284 RepID=A0A8K0RX21_9HYPO|nr:hypothetical protein BKA59DRAFT_456103 [Fusarium tricinctum]
MASTRNMPCTDSPYASQILKLNFEGGKFLLAHRDILQRAPALSKACLEPMSISFNTFHVIYHYLYTGQYQSLKPMGGTDADRWLHGFETAIDVHRSATNLNLPSLRNLAYVELARNSVKMSLESIFRAMGELKVKLDDFPALAAYIKAREMHPKEQQARQEADVALSTHHNRLSSHQFYNHLTRSHPRVQKEFDDARRREIEKEFEFEEHRNHMERLDAAKKCFADHPMKLTSAALDRLAAKRASAKAEKSGSEEKPQQTGKTSDGVYSLSPTGPHDFTAVNTTKPSTEDTPAADTDGPYPEPLPDGKVVSGDWEIVSPTDVPEEEDDDLRTLAISWLKTPNKKKSDASKDNNMR